jgi:hypothetical protein
MSIDIKKVINIDYHRLIDWISDDRFSSIKYAGLNNIHTFAYSCCQIHCKIYLVGKTSFKNRHKLHISLEYVLTILNSNLSFQNFLLHLPVLLGKIYIWAHSILVQRYSIETLCSTNIWTMIMRYSMEYWGTLLPWACGFLVSTYFQQPNWRAYLWRYELW